MFFHCQIVLDSVTAWTTARQASLSFTISQSLLKLMSLESVMPTSHLIFCCPLLLLPSIFPSIKVLSNESPFHTRWPKYWNFNFSISPPNESSGLIYLGLTDLISLQSKGPSRVLSGTIVWKNQFFILFYSPALMSVHDHFKSHGCDYTDLCWLTTTYCRVWNRSYSNTDYCYVFLCLLSSVNS